MLFREPMFVEFWIDSTEDVRFQQLPWAILLEPFDVFQRRTSIYWAATRTGWLPLDRRSSRSSIVLYRITLYHYLKSLPTTKQWALFGERVSKYSEKAYCPVGLKRWLLWSWIVWRLPSNNFATLRTFACTVLERVTGTCSAVQGLEQLTQRPSASAESVRIFSGVQKASKQIFGASESISSLARRGPNGFFN